MYVYTYEIWSQGFGSESEYEYDELDDEGWLVAKAKLNSLIEVGRFDKSSEMFVKAHGMVGVSFLPTTAKDWAFYIPDDGSDPCFYSETLGDKVAIDDIVKVDWKPILFPKKKKKADIKPAQKSAVEEKLQAKNHELHTWWNRYSADLEISSECWILSSPFKRKIVKKKLCY